MEIRSAKFRYGPSRRHLGLPNHGNELWAIHAITPLLLGRCVTILKNVCMGGCENYYHWTWRYRTSLYKSRFIMYNQLFLKSLHWLPVKERIIFKILLVTYKLVHGFAPAYLNELLLNYTPHRLLRSSSLNLLSIPKTKTVTYGDRSFSDIAPKLWNDLPIIIKQCSTVDSFKSRLKTFLFNSVYS